jgi:hypothetical protein
MRVILRGRTVSIIGNLLFTEVTVETWWIDGTPANARVRTGSLWMVYGCQAAESGFYTERKLKWGTTIMKLAM